MGFFDLNIPYLESTKPTKPNTRHREARTKLTAKSMELGYTGIAYNRTITGVMSDNDFCTISLIPLSSLLKLSHSSFPSSVKLHREALGVPLSSPFRQYTRLTVVVDNAAQATSLNSGNPILRTYDLVAVRPTNLTAFEQACLVSEVDIIAIDISENKPFRMRQAMVKAAIQRGICFEIVYSDLLADARARRRVIDNAKLLVNWTRGKHLIFSSASPSVNELRGPYDVANLMSLLGVSMERAKAAISKNCRTLLANALRKKQCYKEAIRVEAITPDEQVGSKEPWYGDWLNYDPISSGEGDLLLEDMTKFFSASNKVNKTMKAIDFASIMDSIPSHGLQLKDLISGTKALHQSPGDGKNIVSAAEVLEVSVATNGVTEEPRTDQISLTNAPSNPNFEHTHKSFLPKHILEDSAEEVGAHTAIMEGKPKISNGLNVCFAPIEKDMHDLQPQDHGSSCKPNDLIQEQNETHLTMAMEVEFDASCTRDASAPFMNRSSIQDEEHERSINSNVVLGAENIALNGVSSEIELHDQAKLPLASSSNVSLKNYIFEGEQVKDMTDEVLLANERLLVVSYDPVEGKDDYSVANGKQIEEVTMEEQDQGEHHIEICYPISDETTAGEQLKDLSDDEVLLADERLLFDSHDDIEGKDGCSVANGEQINEVTMKEQDQGEDHTEIYCPTLDESTAGKVREKQRTPHRAFLFPFKRLLNPIPFKKKARKNKPKIKLV